ncbi:hypothetical protein [Prosthecobacter sp.]|uniref:hypothetical protein n=1 Tax=Prosthecobacter sp. TaxID=1965333 RepID=UPI0037839A5C
MLAEIWNFMRRHWLHMLLAVPGAVVFTLVHEGAHAAAVLVQGGTVLEFVWLPPGDGKWGYVAYDPPAQGSFSSLFVSLAPYLLWFFLAAVVALLSRRRRPFPFWVASSLYFWLFAAPLADVANTAFPYLVGRENDFSHAFGTPSWTDLFLTAALTLLALVAGHLVQRRLYRAQGLGLPAYLVLSLSVVLALLCITVGIPGSYL